MANIYENPSYQAKIGYNGFPMDNVLKFSSTVGELLPIYQDVLQPGDKVTCSVSLETRTMPVSSAAMVSMKEHVEWFFVPLKQIYSLFGEFFFGVQDFESSLIKNTPPNFVQNTIPYVTAANLYSYIRSTLVSDYYFGPSSDITGGSMKLFELFGVPAPTILDDASSIMGYCPIFACAYQKIYSDYYRNSEREQNDAASYNLDKYYDVGTIGDLNAFILMHRLRYRRWAPDFFTHVAPSPLFNAQSVGGMGVAGFGSQLTHAYQQWLTATDFQTYAQGGWTSDFTANYADNPAGRGEMSPDLQRPTQVAPNGIYLVNNLANGLFVQGGNLQQALSPSSIRTSFAVQKLLEVTRRAGKHYDAQQLAHFGVKLPQGISGECVKFGEQEGELKIGDIYATAAGSTGSNSSVLGQVGGRGFGRVNGKPAQFTAPCHGVLMAIYSCEPIADYCGYDKFDSLNHLMDRNTWPTPEFDNLGMQPLFRYQEQFTNDANFDYVAEGWQIRYAQWKSKYNRVCGNLARSLYFWTPFRVGSHTVQNVAYFLINPHYLDNIMLTPYKFVVFDGAGLFDNDLMYEQDPLFHLAQFDIKKASKMSTYGLESL